MGRLGTRFPSAPSVAESKGLSQGRPGRAADTEWGEGSGWLGFVSPYLFKQWMQWWPCPAWPARRAPSRNLAQVPALPGSQRSTTVHSECGVGADRSPPCREAGFITSTVRGS